MKSFRDASYKPDSQEMIDAVNRLLKKVYIAGRDHVETDMDVFLLMPGLVGKLWSSKYKDDKDTEILRAHYIKSLKGM